MCWLDSLIQNSFELKVIKNSAMKIPAKSVPNEIRNWVKEILNGKGLNEYSLVQGKDVDVHMPWHEADREHYKMFQLLSDGSAKQTDFEFERSGMEGDGSITGEELKGKTKVPSGFVIVMVGIYPKRATIYTAEDAQLFLPKTDIDLTDQEIAALYWARSLISSARPEFKDQSIYEKLIEKKLLKKNRSITLEGKNILEDSKIKERLKNIRKFEDELDTRSKFEKNLDKLKR